MHTVMLSQVEHSETLKSAYMGSNYFTDTHPTHTNAHFRSIGSKVNFAAVVLLQNEVTIEEIE